MSVRLDELSVYSLQRLATVLVAAKVMADDSTPSSNMAAEALGNIVVENLCPDALRVQQVGSSSPVTVASHSTRCAASFCCKVSSRRMMRIYQQLRP